MNEMVELRDSIMKGKEFSTAIEVIEYALSEEIELTEQEVYEISANVWDNYELLTMLVEVVRFETEQFLANKLAKRGAE